jgi:hypothetical protein
MGKRSREEQTDCQTDYTVTRCGPEVDGPDGFAQRRLLKGPEGDKSRKENEFTDY